MSVTAGTVFDRSRISLQDWFAAAWYMTNQKHGVRALGLQRLLGLGSYQSAWTKLPISGVKTDCGCEFGADLAGFPLQICEVTLTSLLVMLRSDAQIAKKCRNCL